MELRTFKNIKKSILRKSLVSTDIIKELDVDENVVRKCIEHIENNCIFLRTVYHIHVNEEFNSSAKDTIIERLEEFDNEINAGKFIDSIKIEELDDGFNMHISTSNGNVYLIEGFMIFANESLNLKINKDSLNEYLSDYIYNVKIEIDKIIGINRFTDETIEIPHCGYKVEADIDEDFLVFKFK